MRWCIELVLKIYSVWNVVDNLSICNKHPARGLHQNYLLYIHSNTRSASRMLVIKAHTFLSSRILFPKYIKPAVSAVWKECIVTFLEFLLELFVKLSSAPWSSKSSRDQIWWRILPKVQIKSFFSSKNINLFLSVKSMIKKYG